MKMYYLSLLLLLFFYSEGTAQLSLSGSVMEEESEEPLPGATVFLTEAADSIPIAGMSTDSLGHFQFENLKAGNYVLHIEFVGFNSAAMMVSLHENKALGAIPLLPSDVLSGSVTVRADKSEFVYDIDKQVYNVSQDIFSASSNASEILSNIPTVNVDINGGITLRNTANITFFINGRPSAMLRRNAADYLQQIPASSIERIEIITNPSAKYRPDGVGGIINIVLKDDAAKGVNGMLSLNAGTGYRANGNLSLSYGKKKFSVFGNYGIRYAKPKYLFNDRRNYKNGELITGVYLDTGYSVGNGLSHNFVLGSNFELGDYDNLELSGTYFFENGGNTTLSNIQNWDNSNNLNFAFQNNQFSKTFEGEGEASLAWEHIFKNNEDHNLSFEYAFSAFKEREDLSYQQIYSLPGIDTTLNNISILKGGNQMEILLDYTLPIGENGEIEAGYAGENIIENIEYSNVSFSRFQFNQQVHALYALWAHEIEDFGYKIGLRTEQALIKSHVKLPYDTLIPNNYFMLFPTLHISYQFNDHHQLFASYSKRINRPDSDELNPNPEYSDPRNAESGNALLKPEKVHSTELGYLLKQGKFSLNNVMYYRYKYDAFTYIQTVVNDSVVLSTSANLDNSQSGGLELIFSADLLKNWNFDLSGNVYYSVINAESLGFSTNRSAISGNIKFNTQIKVKENTRFQIGGFYYFPSITPQGKRVAFYYLNAGFRQVLCKNRATISLTVSDMFNSYRIRNSFVSDELEQKTLTRRNVPVIYLGFSWKFNNYRAKEDLLFEGEGLKR